MKSKKTNKRVLFLKQGGRNLISVIVIAVIAMVGCQGKSLLDVVFPQQESVMSLPKPTAIPPEPTATADVSLSTMPTRNDITIWVPPQFDPNSETEAAVLLKNRLLEFSKNNPLINLEVRVKANSGSGSILETLTGASVAAPEGLPSLVLISRSDLVQAATKNLIYPIEGLSGVIDENDWFDVSKELGFYQGIGYCLPFAADALSLVTRNTGLIDSQPTWDEIIRQSERLVFAASDPESLASLALYQSAGGEIFDEAGQPVIEADKLAEVFNIYASAVRFHRLLPSVLDLQTDDQVWEEFLDTTNGVALTWASHSLVEGTAFRLSVLPGVDDEPYTLAKGWVLCQTEPNEQDRIYNIVLAEHLVNSEFLAAWAPVSGYLPVRPSSIPGYKRPEMQDIITKIMLSAHLRPAKNEIIGIGTEIKTSVSEIIQRLNSPEASAQNAANRLEAITIQ